MKKLLLFAAAFIACSEAVLADKEFKTLDKLTLSTAISPNGQYVVGNNPSVSVDDICPISYFYDTSTDEIRWVTSFDENDKNNGDYSKSGDFRDVADNGVICGTAKDPDLMITFTDMFGSETRPANTAAVWKAGKCTRLYYGDFDRSEFVNLGDGSQAKAISADGKRVCGYISTGNGAKYYPCVWTENVEGEWNMERLPVPEGMKDGVPKYMSADGGIIVGNVSDNDFNSYLILWEDGVYKVITNNDIGGSIAGSSSRLDVLNISPNGKYVVVKGDLQHIYIYDIKEDVACQIPNFETPGTVNNATVDNNGNVVSAYLGGGAIRPFWYSYKDNRIFDFTYFMDIFAEGITPEFTFDYAEKCQASPIAMSADGNVIVGNVDALFFSGQTWILKVEKREVSIPATPIGLSAKSKAMGQVTVSWNKDETIYDDITLKKYVVYRNGQKTAEVSSDAPMTLTQDGVAGHPEYAVEAVYETDDGSAILSPRSDVLRASVPDTYDIPLFDDFEELSFDKNYWEVVSHYGDMFDSRWSLIPNFGLIYSSLSSTVYSMQPYSGSLESRPMDATDADKVNMSFLYQYYLVNSEDWPLDKDSLSIDVSTNFGDTWETVKTWTLEDLSPTGTQLYCRALSVDLSSYVAGEIFKVRLRKHGSGAACYMAYADNVKISSAADAPAPTGLIGCRGDDGKSLLLMWHNPSGAYQLNHINVPSITNRFAIGNEGREFIAANSFTKEDLKNYDGKYLTGISTIINYNSDIATDKGVSASVIVFEDGKIVREQEIDNMPYNKTFTVVLDNPLKIDASKELKIGLKYYDYDSQQIPASYIAALNYQPGKSDIYSEDGGVTWQKVSDFYAEQGNPEQGYCCWEITGCITDNNVIVPSDDDGNILTYNVYRNGILLNTSIVDRLQTRFVDPEPVENACYYVEAYYIDGRNSAASEQFYLNGTGIGVCNSGGYISYDKESNCIIVEGEYDRAYLFNSAGICVSCFTDNRIPLGGLQKGIYIVHIEVCDKTYVKKIIIR